MATQARKRRAKTSATSGSRGTTSSAPTTDAGDHASSVLDAEEEVRGTIFDEFFRALTPAVQSVADIEVRGRTTTATVRVNNDASRDAFVGTGKAHCRRDDHFVPSVGEGIATGRALVDLGKKMVEAWSVRSITEETYRVNVAPLKEAVAKATE